MKYFLLEPIHVTRLQEAYIQMQTVLRALNTNSQAYVNVQEAMRLIRTTIAADRYTKIMTGKSNNE